MDKIFGLSLFCNFFAVGIYLGTGQRPINVALVAKVFVFFSLVYLALGLLLSIDIDFLKPI